MTDDPNRQVSLMLAAEHKWAAIAQKHASRARLAFTAKADEVIARHIGGDHPIAAEKLRQAFQGLEAELLLSAR